MALEEDAAFTAFAGYPDREQPWLELLNEAKDLGLDVVGVSIGGKASGKGHFNKMMALAKMAFSVGQSMGHDMKIVDVGLMHDLDQGELDEAIDKHFRGLSYDLIGHLGSEFIGIFLPFFLQKSRIQYLSFQKMYFLVVPKFSENVLVMKAKGL